MIELWFWCQGIGFHGQWIQIRCPKEDWPYRYWSNPRWPPSGRINFRLFISSLVIELWLWCLGIGFYGQGMQIWSLKRIYLLDIYLIQYNHHCNNIYVTHSWQFVTNIVHHNYIFITWMNSYALYYGFCTFPLPDTSKTHCKIVLHYSMHSFWTGKGFHPWECLVFHIHTWWLKVILVGLKACPS